MSEHNEPWSVSKGGWMVDTNLNAATIPKHYRRIVACVNACSGIPTHGLEGMSVALTLSEMADVQQQRDELLLAMKVLRANIDDEYYKLYIDGVLTKVKPT